MADDVLNPDNPMQDDIYQQALAERDRRQQMALLLKGFQQLAGAGAMRADPTYRPDTSVAETMYKSAADPIQDLLRQRKMQTAAAKELRDKLTAKRAGEKWELEKKYGASAEKRKEAEEARKQDTATRQAETHGMSKKEHDLNMKSANQKLKKMGMEIEDKERLTNFLNTTSGPVVNAVRKDLQNELNNRAKAGGYAPELLPEGQSLYELNHMHDYLTKNKKHSLTEYQKQSLDLKRKELEQKKDKALKLSKGEEAVDKEFGKEYAEYVAGGKSADAQKSIVQLQEVHKKLGEMGTATGPIVGIVPKSLRDIITPEGAAVQDLVEEVVQRNLRVILGAQFTEKEGERLIARAYNPRLSEEENQKRVRRLLDQVESAAKAKEEAIRYFEEHGTLKGFKGKIYTQAGQFEKEMNWGDEKSKEVSRRDPKTGRTAIFDANTKKFLRWAD